MVQRSRTLIAVLLAAAVVGLYIVALYYAATWLAPRMPDWGKAVVAIIGALLFMMSPFTAIRVYNRAVGGEKRDSDNQDS
ncbi:positive regulator of sigma E activity [Natronocella acetinitrilica]|uniref:Positive regulator of sigma E activity n=1 Tax=Natronocella acetinitrilica TaxID=414046 RepID=A0AAE3KG17_9GAMM|nr:hypothetical protein [Natronocella acetinitrilica]MCP1674707.1 positive regulator of sigma E activity [Natronocella acetinitrilica]